MVDKEKQENSVAITGSPNNVNELHFDVRSTYLRTPLLGTLLSLRVPVQGTKEEEKLLVLGQVATIETQNRWHEDPSLKNYIKLNGPLPHLTEIGDVTLGKLQIIGAYRTKIEGTEMVYEKTRLAVPPGSGLGISQVDAETIKAIMKRETGYAYLGNFYGSQDVPAPVYVRHFGDFDNDGTGEAYMGGVFGPSGSGKSVIAATLIALWAHNPQMGVLILDPQSEFTANAFAKGTKYSFDFHDILKKTSGGRFDPTSHLVSLDQLKLEGVEIFVQILMEKKFFELVGLSTQKVGEAYDYVTRQLEELKIQKVWKCTDSWDESNAVEIKVTKGKGQDQTEETFQFAELVIKACASPYAASSRPAKIKEFTEQWGQQETNLKRLWDETVALFKDTTADNKPRASLEDLLEATMIHGKIRILDLNPQSINMNQRFKLYLMDFVFKKIRQLSYKYSKQDNIGNCLIVLDEAGRFIPQNTGDDDMLRRLCQRLTDSVKEMRKMRCGFMFITQTIAEIQKDIFRNLHFRIYGVGLGIGADADHIIAREGQDSYELYRSLPDPRLSGTYSFMVAGVLIALGSSGKPMVIEGFSSGEEVLSNNSHLLKNIEEIVQTLGEPVKE